MQNHKDIYYMVTVTIGIGIAGLFAALFYLFVIPKEIPTAKNTSQSAYAAASVASSHTLLPFISNQWYSSLYTSFPSYPLYALPLAYKVTSTGLGFSYPTVTSSVNTIAAPYQEDFSVGLNTQMSGVKVTSVSDWSLSANVHTSSNKSLSFTIGHGIPYATIYPNDNSVNVVFASPVQLFEKTKLISQKSFNSSSFMATINNHNYLFAFSQSVAITQNGNVLQLQNPGRIFVGLLDTKDHYDLFLQNANNDIVDTQAFPSIDSNTLDTTYQIITNTNQPTLIALYPNQFDYLTSQQQVLGHYTTLRGQLSLIKTNAFSTSLPLIVPPGTFTPLTKDYPDLKAQTIRDTNAILSAKPPDSHDYYLGVWFGKVSSLILLADTLGLETQKKQLIAYLEPIFAKSLNDFYYDPKKKSLIAKYPEFGNENLNDHHFHYGYYIRTAAVLSSFDLSFVDKVKDPINSMVSDIGTLERTATDYPYVRNFDVYEGHSWADGVGATPDGNNQESSSEAINAWYGMYLWGKIINDPNIQKYALYLYNTEIISTKYYWFDIKDIYATPYTHHIASIVWGGKVDFATWFSNDTNMKYGIELLPFTPASDYLGTLPDFAPYDTSFHASGGSEQKPWGDLFLMWKSYYDPSQVLKQKSDVTTPEDGNSLSLFLYTLYKNAENSTQTSTK